MGCGAWVVVETSLKQNVSMVPIRVGRFMARVSPIGERWPNTLETRKVMIVCSRLPCVLPGVNLTDKKADDGQH